MIDVVARQAVGLSVLADVRAALERTTDGPRAAAIWYACPDAVREITEVTG